MNAITPTQERALDLHGDLMQAVIKYGSAMWDAGLAAGDHDAYPVAQAKADALWHEIKRLGFELRDLTIKAAR